MNQDWTYRKLGEACVLTMGQSPSSESYNKEGKGLPFFQGCSDFGKLNPTVKTFCNAPAKIAEIGDVLMSVRAPIGTLNIANVKCCIGRGLASFRALPNIDNMYLYYFLKHSNNCLQKLGTGSTFKAIGKESLYNFPIPVPPLAIQSRIVSELDLLQSIIDKQKAQLKELDNLAQAIFYDMFGDPITNEKGWDVKTIKESCKRLYAGGDVPKERFCKGKNTDYTIPIFSNGTENNGLYGYTDEPRETENCITIAGRGTIGYCVIRREPFFPIIRLIVAVPKDEINVVYLKGVIDCLKLKGQGVAIPQLTIPMIKDNIIPVPPLPLQQSFAQKVESIERQKELINQSIREAQTLFDSRMEYYFGE